MAKCDLEHEVEQRATRRFRGEVSKRGIGVVLAKRWLVTDEGASPLRRSELVALQFADVQLAKEGARITIRTSKTDQDGGADDRYPKRQRHAASRTAESLAGGSRLAAGAAVHPSFG